MIAKLLKSQRGEGLISALYTMFILFIVFFVGIDIAGYTGTSWKLRNACSETLALMKIENGYDSNIEQKFIGYLSQLKLDPARVAVTATPQKVQRGDIVTIRAITPYVITSLRPFNKELSFNVTVELSGMAQDFIQEGN